MKIDCRPGEPGYTPEAWRFAVTLDGIGIRNGVAADEEAGEVVVYALTDAGNLIPDPASDGFLTETLRGAVTIRRHHEGLHPIERVKIIRGAAMEREASRLAAIQEAQREAQREAYRGRIDTYLEALA